MALTPRFRAALLPALLVLGACGQPDAKPPGDAPASGAPGAGVAAAGAPDQPQCPRTGHWTECIAFARLEQAGVAPRREGSADGLPAVGVTPTVYTVGSSRVAVYLFADAAARERAARTLDTLHYIAPAASLTMRHEATAIENDNILVLLFSQMEQQRERVSDVFLAGAPQR